MAASSVLNPRHPAGPAVPRASLPQTASWPKATLPPALLDAGTGTATETPPLQRNKPTAAINGRGGTKKRGPTLPPSGKGCTKKRRTAQHDPPASFSSAVAAERILALDKKVAGCLLNRSWAGAAAAWRRRREGRSRTALRCLCLELPRGSRCALHQDAPGWSWMEEQQKGGVPPVGGDGEVLVPMVGAGDAAEVFAEYARWRKNVRMPSRFYMQHVRARSAPDREETDQLKTWHAAASCSLRCQDHQGSH